MEITQVHVDDLIPYENNPRDNDGAVDAVAASIREFGFKVPIVADREKVIVAGHTRLKAAKQLGIEWVPVIIADDLTEEQVKAFRLADNKTGELANWDFAKLEEELAGLELDMEQFGFEIGPGDEPEDEPDLTGGSGFNYKEQYGVIVMCRDEPEQIKVYNELTDRGYECKVVAT